ncbi:MAG: GNAT family N-acetyltransferase [Clostridia bacterium]|nr:GNAT family N-acetyltransferase [Clostridia bacterium]
MEAYTLVRPSMAYAEKLADYRQEFLDVGGPMDGCGSLREIEDPVQYIKKCEEYTKLETLPEGRVLATQFLFVRKSDDRILGMIQVRHHLNDYLSKFGGHLGYSVRPSERRMGYAKAMLKATLPYCRSLGLKRVLITCLENNIGSERTILANGGVYESTIANSDKRLKRFWIEL